MLKVVVAFDELESQGSPAPLAVATLRGRSDPHPQHILAALEALRGRAGGDEVRELPISGLRAGMVIADDLKLHTGTLLVARGYEVTASFLERARLFRPGTVREPVRVIVRRNGLDPVPV
ncbi:MAG: hypothetical protein R3F59_35615 [Myxococcota bacterium]